MKSRKKNINLLCSLILLLAGSETALAQTKKRVNAPYTATCLHPKCSAAAPYSSRALMVCDSHAKYELSAGERALLAAIKAKDHGKLSELLKTVDPDFLGGDALPPIYWAVNQRDLKAVQLLAEAGANLNWTRADGNSLVFDATYNKDPHIAAYLKEHGVSSSGERLGAFTRGFTDAGKDALRNPSKYQRPQKSKVCYSCKTGIATTNGKCASCTYPEITE